jgi:hypothetical protein
LGEVGLGRLLGRFAKGQSGGLGAVGGPGAEPLS